MIYYEGEGAPRHSHQIENLELRFITTASPRGTAYTSFSLHLAPRHAFPAADWPAGSRDLMPRSHWPPGRACTRVVQRPVAPRKRSGGIPQ